MKIICRENCSGKTKELIRESLDTNRPILVFSQMKDKSLQEKSMAYFNSGVNTINVNDARYYTGEVLIDDIDECVDSLLKCTLNNPNIDIGAFTVST